MEVMLLRTFQRQVLLQCEFLLMAAAELDAAVRIPDAGESTSKAFYAIQNLLNAAANISKALWGQGGKLAERRQELRESIGISDTSPLQEVRMRNNFEHFDERLDDWWDRSSRHNYADRNVGPIDRLIAPPLDDIDIFRCYDPTTTEVIFWGQRFHLRSLIDEVNRILPTLHAEAEKPHWN